MRRNDFNREVRYTGNVLLAWAVVGILGGLIIIWLITLMVVWK